MATIIEVKDHVIYRRFEGKIGLSDVLESWDEIFERFDDLHQYKGLMNDLLDSEIKEGDGNLNVLVDYLINHLDRIRDLKVAVVMDTPHVTHTIILGQEIKHLQMKPFTTREAALEWLNY